MAYEYDPRRRRRGRVPPQLRAWVFGRRRGARRARRRFYVGGRRRGLAFYYDPARRRRRYSYDPARRRRIGLWGILSKLAGFGVFVEQVTSKDRNSGFSAMSIGDKAKYLVDVMGQRIAGVSVFHMVTVPRTLNVGGILNKWLGLGILLNIIGMVPGVPMRGRMKSFGRWIAIGGALGGLFDQPALQKPGYNPALAGTPLIPQREKGSLWT